MRRHWDALIGHADPGTGDAGGGAQDVYWRLANGRAQFALGFGAFPDLESAQRDASEVRERIGAAQLELLLVADFPFGWVVTLDGIPRLRSLPGGELRPTGGDDVLSVAGAIAVAPFAPYVHVVSDETVDHRVPLATITSRPAVHAPLETVRRLRELAVTTAGEREGSAVPALFGTTSAGDTAGVLSGLSRDAPIDGPHVHRTAASDVFITDTAALPGRTRFVLAARLPREHRHFRPEGGNIELPLAAEILRQAALAVGHVHFAVPHEHAPILSSLSVRMEPGVALPAATPFDITVDCDISHVSMRSGSVARLHSALVLRRQDGRRFATGTAQLSVIPDSVRARLRGVRSGGADAARRALPAGEVGAADNSRVLLDEGSGHASSWRLRVDPRHALYFDRPLDYVPGTLVIDAVVQAARAALGRPDHRLRSLSGQFTSFLDLNAPVWLVRERAVRPHLRFLLRQRDQTAGTVDVEIAD